MKKLSTLLVSVLVLFSPLLVIAQGSAPKLYVQWAQSNVPDWSLLSVSNWASQPTKLDPIGDTSAITGIGDLLLDNQKGWIFSLNVQGVIFNYYDHYAITGDETSITVTAWRDDPLLFPVGHRQADVAVINSLKFDAKVGQDNTDQVFTFYREGSEYDSNNPLQRPYSEFVTPDASITKPGIYLSDSKFNEFINAETLKGWK
jgi:hypothetical protein